MDWLFNALRGLMMKSRRLYILYILVVVSVVLVLATCNFYESKSLKDNFVATIITFFWLFVIAIANLFYSLLRIFYHKEKVYWLPFALTFPIVLQFVAGPEVFGIIVLRLGLLVILISPLVSLLTATLLYRNKSRIMASVFAIVGITAISSVGAWYLGDKLARKSNDAIVIETKNDAEKIIVLLEDYFKEYNMYPESLDQLAVPPVVKENNEKSKIRYYAKNNIGFSLEFGPPLGFMDLWVYDSDTKEWQLD